jgi:SHS2 domain-containing protein
MTRRVEHGHRSGSPRPRKTIGQLGGESIDRVRHILDHEVKAATRHGLSVRRDPKGWVAEVILDI